MLSELKMVLAKIESPYGSDPTPTTAANFVAVQNLRINRPSPYNETQATDGSLSPRAGTLGKKHIEVSFDHALQVNNAAPTVPPCDPLLKACGYTVTAGVYTPRSTGYESCTLYIYEHDILQHVHGVRGDVGFNLRAGEPAILSFTLQGLYEKPTDSTLPATWTDLGGAPLVAINQAFAYDNTALVVDNLQFGLKNTVTQNPNMDDAAGHGIGSIVITNRNPEGSLDPEMFTAATKDIWTFFEGVTQKAITYVLSNGTAKLTISLPKTELLGPQSGDRGGTATYDLPFRCVRTTGDDEISLTFAAA